MIDNSKMKLIRKMKVKKSRNFPVVECMVDKSTTAVSIDESISPEIVVKEPCTTISPLFPETNDKVSPKE